MTATEAENWFKDAANRLKLLTQFCHNIDEFQELARDFSPEDLIMVMDEPKGKLSGQSNENIRDLNRFAFWIFKHVQSKDYPGETPVYDLARKAGLKVMSKAYYERRTQTGLFKHINIDSIDYVKAGPELKDWFGAFFMLQVSDNINAEIAYDETDWDSPE